MAKINFDFVKSLATSNLVEHFQSGDMDAYFVRGLEVMNYDTKHGKEYLCTLVGKNFRSRSMFGKVDPRPEEIFNIMKNSFAIQRQNEFQDQR